MKMKKMNIERREEWGENRERILMSEENGKSKLKFALQASEEKKLDNIEEGRQWRRKLKKMWQGNRIR